MVDDFQNPLTRKAFTDALRKGLGRAALHVQQYGLDSVVDLVLEACLHNQTYDQQCETPRADWLFAMFRGTPYYHQFHDEILAALQKEEETWKNQLQLLHLTSLMVDLDDAEALFSLKEFVFRKAQTPSDHNWMGAETWVEHAGSAGVLDLARLYGERLLKNPEDGVNDDLLVYQDNLGNIELLRSQAAVEPAVKAYWDYLERRGRLKVLPIHSKPVDKEAMKALTHQRANKEYRLDKILQDARNRRGTYPGRYTYFGSHAAPEELERVFDQLMTESDAEIRVRLLWIFRRAPMPRLESVVFEWANGTHSELRATAIPALAQIQDERIHNLARTKLQEGHLTGSDNEVFNLFLKNYDEQDALLITKALNAQLNFDQDDSHAWSFTIVELAEQTGDQGLSDALKWVYEETPCTNCRHNAILQLDRNHQLSEAMLQESLFDANDSIREFAATKAQ